MNNYAVTLPKEGWKCPVCCAVMSPTYPTCFYCKPEKSQAITSNQWEQIGIPPACGITVGLPACDHDWDFSQVCASNPPKYKCKKCHAYSVFENKAML